MFPSNFTSFTTTKGMTSSGDYSFDLTSFDSATRSEDFLDDLLEDFSSDEWPLMLTEEDKVCGEGMQLTPQSTFSLTSSPPTLITMIANQPQASDVNLQPIKKRRKRNRPTARPFPRILKSDLRRKLPLMYINAVNSGDIGLLESFFRAFCVGSCSLVDNLDDTSICQALREVKPLTVRGLNKVADVLTKRVGSVPDIVTHIEKSWIQHRLNAPGSVVISKVLIKGTLLDNHLVEIPVSGFPSYRLPFFILESLKAAGQLEALTHGAMVQSPGSVGVSVSCHRLEINGWVAFYLDNDNHIYRLEINGLLSFQRGTL